MDVKLHTRIVLGWPYCSRSQIFTRFKWGGFFFIFFPRFAIMAQPITSLIDLDMEDSKLTLKDLGPLSHYWLILKYVVIYPGWRLIHLK